MGEYIEHAGQVIKLGTCEDLYYTTFDGLKAMIRDGAKKTPGTLSQ